MLSGDTSFIDASAITMLQVSAYAEVYLRNTAPKLEFGVDEILEGNKRNEWISDFHISANMDFSAFADNTRKNRDKIASEFDPLIDRWIATKPTFNDALQNELEDYGRSKVAALQYAIDRSQKALDSENAIEFFDLVSHPVIDEFKYLHSFFERQGLSTAQATREVRSFWYWRGNAEMPSNKISAHLFAAIARRLGSGQRRRPTRGTFNDINAISAYAPYVDAMFLDNECAQMLSERPLSTCLPIKAKIFCTRNGNDFLRYLKELEQQTSAEIRQRAVEIYGLTI